jgi:hypothetical protein
MVLQLFDKKQKKEKEEGCDERNHSYYRKDKNILL